MDLGSGDGSRGPEIAEQFYQSLPDRLAVWLKDRKPVSLKQMAELADDYMLPRKGTSTVQQADKSTKDSLAGEPGLGYFKDTVSSGRNGARSTTNFRGEKRCFQCGRYGHLMYNCPNRQEAKATATAKPTMMACSEIEWNPESQKYLRYGMQVG